VEDWSGRPLGLRETESSPSTGTGSLAGDERKLATVVFADLVGSTALGGSQDPERMRALLDRFYDAMAAEIEGARRNRREVRGRRRYGCVRGTTRS
jgi:class 3 adenylate cyclase